MKELHCLRCGTTMKYMGKEKIQLGQTGWLFGDLSNLFAGALEVTVFRCPVCGKLEFFAAENSEHSQSGIPQVTCPKCGHTHDFDYPSCPICKYRY